MKITALYDGDGRILAGIVDDGKYDGPRPVADKTTHIATFEVPLESAKLSLEQICLTHRVDHGAKKLLRGKG